MVFESSSTLQDTKHRVAIVTGSSSGIGRAVACRLNEDGWSVLVNSRRSAIEGTALAASFSDGHYVQGDIARPEDVKKIVDAAVDRWGHIDLLVNNAGMTVRVPHYDLAGATLEVWQEIFGVNLFGTWMMCQVALPRLAEGDGGCIVNMGSLAGLLCAGSSIPYAVSKAAVIHLTRLLARVAGPEVRINAIAPGFIETPWTVARPEVRDAAVASAPLAAAGSVQDIAEGVCWLADSRYITGETITIDGGVNLVHAVSPVPAPPF